MIQKDKRCQLSYPVGSKEFVHEFELDSQTTWTDESQHVWSSVSSHSCSKRKTNLWFGHCTVSAKIGYRMSR